MGWVDVRCCFSREFNSSPPGCSRCGQAGLQAGCALSWEGFGAQVEMESAWVSSNPVPLDVLH